MRLSMLKLFLIVALAVCEVATSAFLMPRFPADPGSPVLKQTGAAETNSSDGLVWIAGSSDKIAYVDLCQRLTVQVEPQFLPKPISYYWAEDQLGMEFTCVRAETNDTKIVSRIFPNNFSYLSGELRANVDPCNGSDFQMAVVKLEEELRSVQFQLSSNCFSMIESIEPAPRLSIKVVIKFSPGDRLSALYSRSLTLIRLNEIVKAAKLFEKPIINGTFSGQMVDLIDQALAGSDLVGSLRRMPFLSEQSLNLLSSLPVYLKQVLNVGTVLTFAESCVKSRCRDSIQIVTNGARLSCALGDEVRDNSTDTSACRDADFFFIDPQSGELHFSIAGLQTSLAQLVQPTVASQRSAPKILRLCETLRFAGHSDGSYISRQIAELAVPISIAPAYSHETTCSAIRDSSIENSTMDLLHLAGSPAAASCPVVCAAPTPMSCALNATWNDTSESAGLICQANGSAASVGVRIRASRVSHFLLTAGIASLPPKVYAVEGESLSYSCSAIVSGAEQLANNCTELAAAISTSVLVPERGQAVWSAKPGWQSRKMRNSTLSARPDTPSSLWSGIVESRHCQADPTGFVIETVTISLAAVPPATDSGNFTHRFLCQLATKSELANRLFGVPELITSEIGADVVFVPRPTDESFNVESLNETTVLFELQPLYVAYLDAVGARVAGGFRLGNEWLNAQHPLVAQGLLTVEFKPSSGRALVTIAKDWPPAYQLTTPQQLTAMFSFRSAGPDQEFFQDSAERCRADADCFYSTDFDPDLKEVLQIELGDQQ